jgi:Zn-dependent M32 family carboxypeptidase
VLAATCALQGWVKARGESNFEQLAPLLQEWVELRREKAALVDSTK